jgi:lambda repressor-like predicted transcriptional regulator
MHPAEIKCAIEIAGSSQTEIARRRKVSSSMVNKVVKGVAVARHIHNEIAVIIGRDVTEIWPDYYGNKAVNH